MFGRKKKENYEITVIDDNKELPDFRKISVPDLKQYLVDGYSEIRNVKKEREELKDKLENALKYKELYEASLVTTNEFKKRDEENQIKIKKLEEQKELKIQENYKLKEIINDYKILEKQIQEREEKIESEINKAEKIAKKLLKEKIIKEISNIKGNISKSKLFDLIEKMEG